MIKKDRVKWSRNNLKKKQKKEEKKEINMNKKIKNKKKRKKLIKRKKGWSNKRMRNIQNENWQIEKTKNRTIELKELSNK